MAVGDLVAQSGIQMPNIQLSSVGTIIAIIILIIIICILFGFGIYWYIMRMKYNKFVVIFEKVGNSIQPTKKDKAMLQRWGKGGDYVFITRKTKLTLPRPTIQVGKNTYYFYQTSDGEMINFGIQDIDKVRKEMDIHFLDKEMRYARVALQKNFQERFNKVTFWDKYGGFIAYTILILIICIGMWLIFDKMTKGIDSANQVVSTAGEVTKNLKELLGAMDNICPKTGLVPAGGG